MYWYLLVAVTVLSHLATVTNSSWTQQYGDPGSTSYVPSSSSIKVTTGWNYTVPNDYDYYPVSLFANSPSVSSKNGVIFIPFAFSRPYPVLALLQVRAVSPDGKELWVTSDLDTSNQSCAYILMTNALYSEEHDMVIAGFDCGNAWPYYEELGQIYGINASNGSIIWVSPKLNITDAAMISMNKDTIFLSAGFNCYEDFNLKVNKQNINSSIMGLDISTGNIRWATKKNNAGCRTAQTKVSAPLEDNSTIVMFPVNLPEGPYPAGDILSLRCSSSSSTRKCKKIWLGHIGITYNAQFAFTDSGIMYGTYGLAANPKQIFAVDARSGNVIFSRSGACPSGAFPSGPAVDRNEHAYFSCGNKAFAVNSKGNLLWESKTINNYGYPYDEIYKLSPAIHLDKNLVVFIDANSTYLYALSSKDGSIVSVTSIMELRGYNGCTEPPLLIGDAVYIVKAEADYSTSFLYSIPLKN